MFCIYVTCDNLLSGCDDISFKMKMECNTASGAASVKTSVTVFAGGLAMVMALV